MKKVVFFGIVLFVALVGCKQENRTVKQMAKSQHQKFREPHRPQFHFTPPSQWMNDPNGMFHYNGEYHLSYQYYPDSTVWGPMHWGHAISKDLIHWEHMPIALYPDSLGYIFSGGTVVDVNNTSGFGSGNNPPMVATFTYHDPEGEKAGATDFQTQGIAYSTDKGRSWKKYAGNPVIPNQDKIRDFRDPKVVWHPDTEKWILSLAAYDEVQFFSSKNLKDWTFLSAFGLEGDDRLWECPDLFPIVVQETGATKWVLIVSIQKKAPNGGNATSYFVGDFDGTEFKADVHDQKWLDWGTDNYAFVTWDNVPKEDGRRIGIGWMSNWDYAQVVPTKAWRSAMTLPRELQLYRNGDDHTLGALPVRETVSLRASEIAMKPLKVKGSAVVEGDFDVMQCELDVLIDLKETTAKTFGLELSNEQGEKLMVTIDTDREVLMVDRTESSKEMFSEEFYRGPHTAPLSLKGDVLDMRMFLDASSIELFLNKGALNFTAIFFPTAPYSRATLFSKEGRLVLKEGQIFPLKSIWD
ncbi:glycoside hydrolase family 32 protein [Maribacter sp. 2307ULW6-5]|uniref:glycoside hydrolase family 32 protein n=1 Tax=Maribacter sp. 2307ULW6-5 TaxID=3386275 RepID=UPI0039BD5857